MLKVHRHGLKGVAEEIAPGTNKIPADAGWLDLINPTDAEISAIEAATGLKLPTRAQLDEVEVSSRLRRDGSTLTISLPVLFRDERKLARITPVGFVLSAEHLITVRYEHLKAFATCGERIEKNDVSHPSTVSTFVVLLEAIVDRLADVLEEVGAELDHVADDVFGQDADQRKKGAQSRDAKLRATLRRVGRARQVVSKVRATLLGIARAVPYIESEGEDWLPEEARPRLETVRRDVDSLDEYEVHLSDKVQFLLDADLGLINIEQNDRFRILTVVTIIGIPPTLVASMYGMNFKHMPELDWEYGYAYGLVVILLSAVLPIFYFRAKGAL